VNIDLHLALRAIARVLEDGERPESDPNHWTRLPVKFHLAKGLVHAEKALLGVSSPDDDLAHAAVRLLLGLELRERQRAAATKSESDS
jgi:hypothetical protein